MVDTYHILERILLAAILSGIIGFERELHGRAAGLRTNILVGIGSCLIMLTSMHMFDVYQGKAAVDPGRIAAQVVSGIGFLGAGTILRSRASILGLTTAAGLWAVAGIGLSVGSGLYNAAFISTAVIFAVLFFLSRVERRLKKDVMRTLRIEAVEHLGQLSEIKRVIDAMNIETHNLEICASPDGEKFNITICLKPKTPQVGAALIDSLLKIKNITNIRWL